MGINAIYDRELYKGKVPYINLSFPHTFGVEATGVIEEIGNQVTNFKKGDTVGTIKVGTAYQEYQNVDAAHLIPFPEATPEYLTLGTTGVSAYLAIEKLAEIQNGETVVISAAAGGLGHILVQLCKKKGAKIVAICGTDKKCAMLESLGCCDHIIQHRRQDVDAVLSKEYGGKIDVAIDSVGRHMFDSFLKNIAPKGRLIVVGLASELSDSDFESRQAPRVYQSIYWKGASVRCFMNHLYKQEHTKAREHLFTLYQKKLLQIKIDSTVFKGIEAIKTASQYLLAGKSCGKLIVEL